MTRKLIGSKTYNYPTEVYEVCPHCEEEIHWPHMNPVALGYRAICPNCGKEILICSECRLTENSLCDWRRCENCETGECFRSRRRKPINTITFETFPPANLNDYNWDHLLRRFTVPRKWAENWISIWLTENRISIWGSEHNDNSLETFFEEYTWEDTYQMYECARNENVITEEHLEERPF